MIAQETVSRYAIVAAGEGKLFFLEEDLKASEAAAAAAKKKKQRDQVDGRVPEHPLCDSSMEIGEMWVAVSELVKDVGRIFKNKDLSEFKGIQNAKVATQAAETCAVM